MYKNILIPVVFDEKGDTQTSLEIARELAADGARFTVLHVMEPLPGYAAAHIPEDVLANTRHEVEKALNRSAEGLPGAETVLASGHAGRYIVDYANDNGVDCIVIRSHVPGIGDVFLGSTADRVVRRAKCAVHVIR